MAPFISKMRKTHFGIYLDGHYGPVKFHEEIFLFVGYTKRKKIYGSMIEALCVYILRKIL